MFIEKKLTGFVFAFVLSWLAPSAFSQSLTGFLMPSSDHAFYIAANQHVYQSFFTGSGWTSQDLTAMTGNNVLAVPGSALASLTWANQGAVYCFDTNRRVNQLLFTGSAWVNQTPAVAPPAAPGSVLSSILHSNANHIFYFDANRHVNHLWYAGQNWGDDDLTAQTQTPVLSAPGSSLAAVGDEATGNIHVYYIDANQHINQFFWNNTAFTWSRQDLTVTSQTKALASLGSALAGFDGPDGNTHMFYFDRQPHVTQLWGTAQTWYNEDWTAASRTGAVPAPASGITCFMGPNGTAAVYYVDTHQHVNQLQWTGSQYVNTDLTAAGIGPDSLAAPQTALTSLLITGGNHVYYVDTRGHVNQIYWNGNAWVSQDLTVLGQGAGVSSGLGNVPPTPFVREYIYGNGRVIALENGRR